MNSYTKGEMIRNAAELATAHPLTRLYTLAENQKTVSKDVLLRELDFAAVQLSRYGMVMRKGADCVK